MNGLSQKRYLELLQPKTMLDGSWIVWRQSGKICLVHGYFPLPGMGKLGNGGDRGRRYHRAALWAGGGSGNTTGGETSGLQQWRDFEGSQVCFNKQIQWGQIFCPGFFYCKDNREKLDGGIHL